MGATYQSNEARQWTLARPLVELLGPYDMPSPPPLP